MELCEILQNSLQNSREKIAVKTHQKDYPYGEVIEIAADYATILTSISSKRINIGIILPNSVDYIEWLYASILSDNVAVPIYYKTSLEELKNIIHTCHITVLICPTNDVKKYSSIISEHYFSLIDGYTAKVYTICDKRIAKSKAYSDTVVMLSTSGSISNPKRVMLSNRNIIANVTSIIDSLHYSPNEIFGILSPFCFASANTSQLFTSLLLGSTVAIYEGLLLPQKIQKFVQDSNVTTLTVVPSTFKLLVDSGYFNISEMPSLKTICFGGGPTNDMLIEKALVKFSSINLTHMYGQTEASTRISHMPLQTMPWKKGSVGKALKGINVKIHDADKDGNGEICIQGENVTSGYYDQITLTNKTIMNGWLHTGDIGRIDNEGYIFITGRKKNLIIYCGLNVYPEEVENILLQHPFVEDAIVFGKSDISYGEKIFANVVLSSHHSNWKSILMEHCKNNLTDYKIPYDIFDVDKIQRTNNGKVKRNHENKYS